MIEKYPFIQYPISVFHYLNDEIPELFPIKKPEYKKLALSYGFLILFVICLIGGVFLLKSIIIVGVASLIVSFLSFVTFVTEVKTVNTENIKRKTDYENAIVIYKENQKKQNELIRKISSTELRRLFIQDRIETVSKEAIEPIFKYGSISQKGITEIYFLKFLTEIFEDKIFSEYTIPGQDEVYGYTPDFVYNDRNMIIDIEIDEPYFYKNKSATHYYNTLKDRHSDDERNNYFVSRNWYVVRFAEEQIVLHPYGCCKVIADLILQIQKNELYTIKLENYKYPIDVKFWNKEEAEEMSKNNFRNNYLKRMGNLLTIEKFKENHHIPNIMVIRNPKTGYIYCNTEKGDFLCEQSIDFSKALMIRTNDNNLCNACLVNA